MISVIVPVYNVEKYIEKCIRSVLDQTYKEFELILVNDGSTDGSGDICDMYERKDGRIRVLHQENKGLSEARNAGLFICTGEYITYIDSDDSVEPDYLEELYRNLAEHRADVSVCAYRLVWEDKNRREKEKAEDTQVHVYTGREAAKKIVAENDRKMITAWGKLYHRRMKPLLVYPSGKTHEDEFVTYRVFYTADRVVVTERPLYLYLQRGSSIMNNGYSERRLDKIEALKEAVEFFRDAKDEEMKRYAQKRYLLHLAIAWYRVSAFLPERKELLGRLREEWLSGYKSYWRDIKETAGVTDRVAVRIYALSPRTYGMIAGIYEKIFREV